MKEQMPPSLPISEINAGAERMDRGGKGAMEALVPLEVAAGLVLAARVQSPISSPVNEIVLPASGSAREPLRCDWEHGSLPHPEAGPHESLCVENLKIVDCSAVSSYHRHRPELNLPPSHRSPPQHSDLRDLNVTARDVSILLHLCGFASQITAHLSSFCSVFTGGALTQCENVQDRRCFSGIGPGAALAFKLMLPYFNCCFVSTPRSRTTQK
ncbi:hypothetical protein B2J93_2439 [Marssonina coronariae]|uniref:Uncharacterized protein n=1 Tax=Diplocarpon coronariae TaxID=2795749 RepID=A0A218YXP1_9HELO|nr:hypothetical protein B2J93_2439 [Marssonina coronariae]